MYGHCTKLDSKDNELGVISLEFEVSGLKLDVPVNQNAFFI